MKFNWILDLNFVLAAMALFITCLFFYVQSRREQRGLKREIYQRLELASNDLFRFEADHLDILECLNSAERRCSKNSPEYKGVIAYVTQVLNLFEMAVRFRTQRIMPDDVFGSWITWFYDLCSADNFPDVWEDIEFNYLPELRQIINTGISIVGENQGYPEVGRQKFFEFIANRYGDRSLASWLTNKTHVH